MHTCTQQRLKPFATVHSVVNWFTQCIQVLVTTTEPSNTVSLLYNTQLTVLYKKSYQKEGGGKDSRRYLLISGSASLLH